jgi:dUTP pyrophosphatase
MVALTNLGQTDFVINKGDRIAQGIFLSYLTSDDDAAGEGAVRQGGFGSTGTGA